MINCIRFDEKATEERKKKDALTAVRDIWELLMELCKNSYIPSSYMTIDEQLLGFSGKYAPFRCIYPQNLESMA